MCFVKKSLYFDSVLAYMKIFLHCITQWRIQDLTIGGVDFVNGGGGGVEKHGQC